MSNNTERVEMGLEMISKINRLQDTDLRVLICTATYFVLDGVTLTIRRLENHLRSRGATVKILSTVPENIDRELCKDLIIVPGIKIPFNHAGEYSFGVGLDESTIAQIEAYKPNIVHFTVPDFVGLDGIRWCQRNNIAYIGTWHSNYCDYLKYYYLEWILGPGLNSYLKGFFEQLPTVYVPTPYMLNKMKNEWGYGSATELREWGRGVDMQIFSPDRRSMAFRQSKGISDSDIVVLWVSRIVPEKRPDIFLDVVKRLQDEGLPVKPLVVGSGTYEKYLSKLQHVVCCGWLSGTSLGEAYASSDILLFPSDVETFGNVTLESLAAGCPCVVEKKCGEHLVTSGLNGLTCTAGDAEEFYRATRALVLDAHLRQTMALNARESAAKYDRHIILQQMAENYKDAIQKHRDPAFLHKHLQSPEGAGRNLLSLLCCNFYLIKMVAEPFLQTSGKVQEAVDGAAECVQHTRTRLSCADFLSSAALSSLPSSGHLPLSHSHNGGDVESGGMHARTHEEDSKKGRKCVYLTTYAHCLCNALTQMLTARLLHYTTTVFAVCIVLVFVYASFTV